MSTRNLCALVHSISLSLGEFCSHFLMCAQKYQSILYRFVCAESGVWSLGARKLHELMENIVCTRTDGETLETAREIIYCHWLITFGCFRLPTMSRRIPFFQFNHRKSWFLCCVRWNKSSFKRSEKTIHLTNIKVIFRQM